MMTTNSRHMRQMLAGMALIGALCGAASAAPTLYEQLPSSPTNGFQSTSAFQNADSFTLSFAANITGLTWWGTTPTNPGNFVVRWFSDLPGDADGFDLLTGTITPVDTSLTVGGREVSRFEMVLDLSSQKLAAAGHEYYVSVWLDDQDPEWGWLLGELDPGDGRSAFRGQDGVSWSFLPPGDPEDSDLAFAVSGERIGQDVPEPSVLALVLIAGLAAARAGQRRAV